MLGKHITRRRNYVTYSSVIRDVTEEQDRRNAQHRAMFAATAGHSCLITLLTQLQGPTRIVLMQKKTFESRKNASRTNQSITFKNKLLIGDYIH